MNVSTYLRIVGGIAAAKHYIDLTAKRSDHVEYVLHRLDEALIDVMNLRDEQVVHESQIVDQAMPDNQSVGEGPWSGEAVEVPQQKFSWLTLPVPFAVNGVQYGPNELARVYDGDQVHIGVAPTPEPPVNEANMGYGPAETAGLSEGLAHGGCNAAPQADKEHDPYRELARQMLKDLGIRPPPLKGEKLPPEVASVINELLAMGVPADQIKVVKITK